MSINLKAYAKINLWLDITGRRQDGYHELNTVMQRIGLFDNIELSVTEDAEKKIIIECDDPSVPVDENNIAYKACRIFAQKVGSDFGAKMKIQKHIPVGAGLGGSSADGAAVLLGLNEMYQYKFNMQELCAMAAGLGADVPFCIYSGAAVCTGIGDSIRPIKCPKFAVVIVKPEFSNSTSDAYRKYDEKPVPEKEGFSDYCALLTAEDIPAAASKMYNIFEKIYNEPLTDEIKSKLISSGALGACMSGSGSAVFGIFDDLDKAQAAARALPYEQVFAVGTV